MPDDSDENALARAFAEAIMRPGGGAKLVREDGTGVPGWVSINDALDSGLAFAVEPCEHMVAIDIDDEGDHEWAGRVRVGLTPVGCHFVIVESGRDGHQHMWVLMPPGWTYEYLKVQMEATAGAPNTWKQVRRTATRPPFAPHRLGGRSRIVDPGLQTALKLFRSHRPRDVPRLARDALQWLDPQVVVSKRGVVDRGRTIHKAAVSLVNARCTPGDLEELLRADNNAVTSKWWEMPPGRRTDYVELVWKKASEWVRANPPKAADREIIEGLLADIGGMEWAPRTGGNDRAVYAALLDLGIAAGTLMVNASARQLSDLTSLSPTGVQAALGRLLEQGFVVRPDQQNRPYHLASSFRLVADVPRKTTALAHTWSFLGGPKARCAEELEILAEVFANPPGLGLSTRETWEALPTLPTKTAELVALMANQRPHGTVRTHLNKLSKHGLAGRKGHRWWRLEPGRDDLIRLALQLGVRGKNRRRRDRHERERQAYRELFGHQLPSKPAA